MIDKDILQMPKIKKILVLLAGFSFLQAVFIIGQAFFLSKASFTTENVISSPVDHKNSSKSIGYIFFQKPLSAFGVAGILTNNYRVFYSFLFFILVDMLLRIFVRECSIHLVMNARKNYANNY